MVSSEPCSKDRFWIQDRFWIPDNVWSQRSLFFYGRQDIHQGLTPLYRTSKTES